MATVQHPFLKDGVEARAYQFEALKYCLSASTLMVMPTGYGKTAVEWMAMANCLQNEKGKILLIAPTTGLVEQQQRMARSMIRIDEDEIITYTGENAPAKRGELWHRGTIIIATPQVIRNDVQNGVIDLNEVGLMIFDEAHHATGNHAYAQVGKLLREVNPDCFVIGATASPGSTESAILQVADSLNIQTFSISKKGSSLLQPFQVNMKITPHYLDIEAELKGIILPIQVHQNSEAEQLRKMGFLAPTGHLSSKMIEDAQRRTSIAIQRRDTRGYNAARKVSNLRRIHLLLDLLRTQGLKSAQLFVERAEEDGRSGQRGTNSFIALPTIHNFRNSTKHIDELHPKPDHAAGLVSQQLKASPTSKVLVFTEFRDTVELLRDKLNSIDGVTADRFIGQSGTGKRKGMNQKQQLEQLRRFREGEINVLIATSVGEEGLDVPAADLVILYEPVASAIRAIQRRGRTARQRDGEVHILIANDTRDVFVYAASKRREEKMYSLLDLIKGRGRIAFRPLPTKEVLDDFSVIEEGNTIAATQFLASEKERLSKLYPVIEVVQTQPELSKKSHSKSSADDPTTISPAMRRPSQQMGLESFIGRNSQLENKTSAEIQDEDSVVDREIEQHRRATSSAGEIVKSGNVNSEIGSESIGNEAVLQPKKLADGYSPQEMARNNRWNVVLDGSVPQNQQQKQNQATSQQTEKKLQQIQPQTTLQQTTPQDENKQQKQLQQIQPQPHSPLLEKERQKAISKEDGQFGIIQVDHRESSTTFVAHMRSLKCNIQLTHLYHGDVRISDRVLIERKSSRDIISSLMDGRLLSQCRRLLAAAPRPLLLVEMGSGNGHAVHPNAVLGALAHITLDLGVPVMMTQDAKESAHFISIVARREFDLLEKLSTYSANRNSPKELQQEEIESCIRAANKEIISIIEEGKKSGPLADRWQRLVARQRVEVLAAIPNLGTKKAQLLLEHFGTIAAVLCAGQKELAKVKGIGPATAAKIDEILNA